MTPPQVEMDLGRTGIVGGGADLAAEGDLSTVGRGGPDGQVDGGVVIEADPDDTAGGALPAETDAATSG